MNWLSACPVCASTKFEKAYSAPTTRGQDNRIWDVSECDECSHQFMNPQPSWEELQPYYDEGYDPYNPMHGSAAADEQEIARANQSGLFRHIPIPAGQRILDVGCGAGWFLRIAKKLGAIEQGVEPSLHAANLAREQGLRVFHGTLEAYLAQRSEKNLFDVVTANHVIEHVPNPVETLESMRNLLAPMGYIWISVPNASYPICRALKGLWHSTDLPYHLMQFTPRSIVVAGARANLTLRRQTTESIPRIVSASLRQYLRYKCLLPRRLTERVHLIDRFSSWYAKRVDAKSLGEAILTEFTAGTN